MKYLKFFLFFVFIHLSSENFSQKIKVIEINNLDLNSEYAEIGIKYIQNQKILFASSKKDNSNKKRDKRNNRHMGLRLYTGSVTNNGSIGDIELFGNTENNPISESNITFSSDRKTVYFTRNNYIQDDYRKQFKKDTLDDHNLKLFKASLDPDGSLTNIIPLPINNAAYSVTNPQLSPDNKKLFFISDMKGSIGEFDIYEMDIYADGTYGKPKNLGNKINSKGTEMFPFVTQDNILYFASNGRGGFGELDIFSFSLDNANAKSINLGEPVNSKKDDFSFIYNKNNLTGYFASNRKGGKGDADLYSFLAEPTIDKEQILDTENVDSNEENEILIAANKVASNNDKEATIVLNNPEATPPVLALNDDTKEENEILISTNKAESNNDKEATIVLNNSEATPPVLALNDDTKEENEILIATNKAESNNDKEVNIVLNNSEATPPVLAINDISKSNTTEENLLKKEVKLDQIDTASNIESQTNQEQSTKVITTNSSNNTNTVIIASSVKDSKTLEESNFENEPQKTVHQVSESSNKNLSEENELVEFKEESKITEVASTREINESIDTIIKLDNSVIAVTPQVDQNKQEEKCIQIVEGYVQNNSNTVLSDAKITVYENGKNIGTFDISPEGKYSLELKCNFHYRITARLNKFEETYFELRTNRFSGSKTTTNIILDKIPCNILITGKFIDINTGAPIADAKLYLIKDNQQVSLTATKKDGSYKFSGECDESYQINTDKYGYEEGLFSISQSSVNNTTIKFDGTLTPLPCLQVLNGRVTNLDDGVPIVNATVSLYNKNGSLKETAQSNTNGNFHFTINCDESYILKASNKFFETATSATFNATSNPKEVHRLDLPLKATICNQTIEGLVVNARTKTPMGNVEVSLLKDGVIIETKTVSGKGFFNFNILCKSNYSIEANAKDFNTNTLEFTSSEVRNEKVEFTLHLESKLDYELVRGQMMILIEPISFDLDKADITEEAAIELAKIISAMTKNSNITVDIGVHTDSRAPDNYNLTLSDQRAKSIMNYIISRGIDQNRLTGNGYGETELLNKCSNGVKCTESEHLENQRIEFKVNQ